MIKKYDVHYIRDIISLAKYVQTKVYWGGNFIRKDDETNNPWSDFWDHLEGAIEDGCSHVIINDIDNLVEFRGVR